MGNRAVITLEKDPNPSSIGIYLHWNGGPESALAFAEAARHYNVRCSDQSYGIARLAQIIGNYFGGTLSVGVGTLATLDCENFDNGVMSVQWDKDSVKIKHWPDGKYATSPGSQLDTNGEIDRIKKTSSYWNNPADTMLMQVLEKNNKTFKEE